MSAADGEILVTLSENHRPTAGYVRTLRKELNDQFPDLTFFFSAARHRHASAQFRPAGADRRAIGRPARQSWRRTTRSPQQIRKRIAEIPGAVDAHLQQVPLTPELHVDADRTLLSQLEPDAAGRGQRLLVSLSSSGQTAPNFWLDPKTGVQYPLAVQTPQYKIDSVERAGQHARRHRRGNPNPQLLANVASVQPSAGADERDALQRRA